MRKEGGGNGFGVGEQLKEDGQGIEVLEPCGLDETHQDRMIFDALVRAIAEGDLAEDDIVTQQTLYQVVMGADARHFHARDQLTPYCWMSFAVIGPRSRTASIIGAMSALAKMLAVWLTAPRPMLWPHCATWLLDSIRSSASATGLMPMA